MRKIVVTNSMALDGVMQAPGRADEDTHGGFTHGGWAGAYNDARTRPAAVHERRRIRQTSPDEQHHDVEGVIIATYDRDLMRGTSSGAAAASFLTTMERHQ